MVSFFFYKEKCQKWLWFNILSSWCHIISLRTFAVTYVGILVCCFSVTWFISFILLASFIYYTAAPTCDCSIRVSWGSPPQPQFFRELIFLPFSSFPSLLYCLSVKSPRTVTNNTVPTIGWTMTIVKVLLLKFHLN